MGARIGGKFPKRRRLSWLSNGSNSSLLAWSVRQLTICCAPLRQPGARARFRSGDTTAGTR